MHSVEFYQLPKTRQWRWKFLYNKKVLARGEGHYATKSHAKRAFKGFVNGIFAGAGHSGPFKPS